MRLPWPAWPLPSALLLAILLLTAACARNHEFSGTVLDPAQPAPDFVLADQAGHPFRLSEQQGKVVLLYFGFTSCPDVCPTDVARLAAVQRALGEDAEQVQVAFITVDPERDDAAALARYLASFNPSFTGLWGSPEELAGVYQDYGVSVARRELPGSALEYTIDHSAYTYLIDQAGRWRAIFPHGNEVDAVAADVRYFIRTGGA